MRAQLLFEVGNDEYPLLTFIDATSDVDEHWLRKHPETPPLYEAGVVYEREGIPEKWYDVPHILQRTPPRDDCEGLAAWRAAELRIAGYPARPVLRRYQGEKGALYHVIVEADTPDGPRYDDPSARLGMFDSTSEAVGNSAPSQLSHEARRQLLRDHPDADVKIGRSGGRPALLVRPSAEDGPYRATYNEVPVVLVGSVPPDELLTFAGLPNATAGWKELGVVRLPHRGIEDLRLLTYHRHADGTSGLEPRAGDKGKRRVLVGSVGPLHLSSVQQIGTDDGLLSYYNPQPSPAGPRDFDGFVRLQRRGP